jgi:6-pyruvoyl-tetrahydropterin synthase
MDFYVLKKNIKNILHYIDISLLNFCNTERPNADNQCNTISK